MAEIVTINVARSFSRFPAGRVKQDGPFSGAVFRDDRLVPALRRQAEVVVELDGVEGYGSSFLEEAFGGLVRVAKFSEGTLRDRLKIKTANGSLEHEVWSYITKAQKLSRIAGS